MKGFIQGSLWGLVIGVAGLSFASLVSEQPNFAAGPDAPQLVAPELEVVMTTPPAALEATEDGSPVFAPVATLDEVVDESEDAPDVSTEPATLPETADVAAAMESADAPTDTDVSAEADAPTAPRVETALIEPTLETDAPEVDTAPADTPPSEPVESEAADVEVAAVEPEPEIETETAAAEEMVAAPETEDAPVVAEEPVTPAEEPTVVETATPADPAGTPSEDVTVAEALPQTNAAVRINRPGADAEEPEAETTEVEATSEALPDDAPALLRYAVPFEDTGVPSRISVILIDEGEMADAVSVVADLGFVPTITVNALSPASTDLAAEYRAVGVEVAMQAMLPDGAQPTDVEVAFQVALGTVPEVAMLFSDGTGAMQNRAVTAQVMEVLAADGYGFVTVQRGLSNAARAAEQAGVPAATILRDIDGAGEDVRAITRGLDQAAFRARQTGDAVLLGRVRPETLEALRAWAADLDQETLAIAPVSAILLSEE